jgi:CDP-4-dehydro-6-deoxyglucose reductase
MKNAAVSSVQSLAPNLVLIRLAPEGGLDFKAGQFIIVHLPPDPQAAPGDKPPKGFYSLASAEHQGGELEILVENCGGYVSAWMCALRPGDRLQLEGPLGKFGAHDSEQAKQMFLGYRAGLAPLRSLIHSMHHAFPQRQLRLFLGGEALFEGEWAALAASSPRFHFHPCADPAEELLRTEAARGGQAIYMAGFNAEVDPMITTLVAAGYDRAAIKAERFG